MMLAALPAWSHVVTGGEGLDGNKIATLVIDFSETEVDGMPLDEFLHDLNQTAEFEEYTAQYYTDFIKRFCDRCESILLTRSAGRSVTLTVKVLTVNRKGNEAICDYIFTETETGKTLLTVSERTREGRVGSFSNLLGDVLREAGGDFGRFMNRYLKKDKKDKTVSPDFV